MFYFVYVLQSDKDDSLYVGMTEDLQRRFMEHNRGENRSTKFKLPWSLIYYEARLDKDDAVRREKYLKTNQGARLLKRTLKEYLYRNSNRRISTTWYAR